MIGAVVIPATPATVAFFARLVAHLSAPRPVDPADALCGHHAGTLRAWRREHPHEEPGDYARRCGEYARQCCAREDQP